MVITDSPPTPTPTPTPLPRHYSRKAIHGDTRFRGYSCDRRSTRRAPKECPRGYHRRAVARYTHRKKHGPIPEECIRNARRKAKRIRLTPGIGPLRKGELAKFGYSNVMTLSESERHAALVKAIKAYGSLSVWRKLNAVAVYTRYTAPAASRIFTMDKDWIRFLFGIKASG